MEYKQILGGFSTSCSFGYKLFFTNEDGTSYFNYDLKYVPVRRQTAYFLNIRPRLCNTGFHIYTALEDIKYAIRYLYHSGHFYPSSHRNKYSSFKFLDRLTVYKVFVNYTGLYEHVGYDSSGKIVVSNLLWVHEPIVDNHTFIHSIAQGYKNPYMPGTTAKDFTFKCTPYFSYKPYMWTRPEMKGMLDIYRDKEYYPLIDLTDKRI